MRDAADQSPRWRCARGAGGWYADSGERTSMRPCRDARDCVRAAIALARGLSVRGMVLPRRNLIAPPRPDAISCWPNFGGR